MQVAPEDLVACTMELKQGTASTWDQTCINLSNNNQTVSAYCFRLVVLITAPSS